jgi:alpha-L-fucosidase
MRLRATLLAAFVLSPAVLSAQAPAAKMITSRPGETAAQHDARMAWWRQAKFGMFVHWGLYAIPADGEWHMRQHHQTIAPQEIPAAEAPFSGPRCLTT